MPVLTITPSYSSGAVLTKAQIDTLVDPITTLLNTTKLDSANVDLDDVVAGVAVSEAGIIFTQAGLGNIVEATDPTTSLTTTYATVTTVTAPTTGDYLIMANSVAGCIKTSTTGASDWDGYIYARFYNTTTTVAIGPEVSVAHTVNATTTALASRSVDVGFSMAYIVSLAAGNVVGLQAYKYSNSGLGAAKLKNTIITMLRLVQ